MPGHVKRGGTGEPDPDPTPFLYVSFNEKQKDMAKVHPTKNISRNGRTNAGKQIFWGFR